MGVFEEVDQGHLVGQGRGHLDGSQPFRLLLASVSGTPTGQIRFQVFLDFAELVELLTPGLDLSRGRSAKCQVGQLAADLGELRQGWRQFGLVAGQPILASLGFRRPFPVQDLTVEVRGLGTGATGSC